MDSKINRTGLSETTSGSLRGSNLSRITTRSEPNSPSPTQRLRSFANSTISSERKSPKVPTPPERTPTRGVNGSSELIQLKEDLRKANDLIASLERENAKAFDEHFDQLCEALEAQKRAKEKFEIEKFEAVEAGVEAFQRKEEVLKKELEVVKNQHASDSAVLVLVTRELEKVTQELASANDAKSKLLSQAEMLSSEMIRLKAMLDSTQKKETISNKEMVVLRSELKKARCFEVRFKERDVIIEKLDAEIEVLKMAESNAHGSADLWSRKSLELTRELKERNKRLEAMECEVTDLQDKVKLMAKVGAKQSEDLEKSEELLETAEELFSKIEKEAGRLKSELDTVKEEKRQALKREQEANSKVQKLFEEKSRILSELENSREEEERSKKAMESLASSAREMKEKLLSLGSEDYETQVEHYKKMLDEARHEIDVLVSSKVDWEMREAGLVNHVKRFDEEVSSMGKEMNRLGSLVKRTQEEADAALKKESQTRDDLKEVEDEVIHLQETLREARAESLKLNAKMLDKESEFQSVLYENDLLRVKQVGSMNKIKLLEEALAKKHAEEDDGELIESEQDYVVEFSEENGHRSAEENVKLEEDREVQEDDDTVEVEYSMLESYHTEAFHKGK